MTDQKKFKKKKSKKQTNLTHVENLFSQFEVTSDDVKSIKEAKYLVDKFLIENQVTVIVGAASSGKTAITQHCLKEIAARGYEVLYMDLDSSPQDAMYFHQKAKEEGWKYLNPLIKRMDFDSGTLYDRIKQLAKENKPVDKLVIVIDTLRKFIDSMGKGSVKEFFNVFRKLTNLGATGVCLHHANKHRDSNNQIVVEGVGDIMNDCDTLLYIYPKYNKDKTILTSTIYPSDKARGIIKCASFTINKNTRVVERLAYHVETKNSTHITDDHIERWKKVYTMLVKDKGEGRVTLSMVRDNYRFKYRRYGKVDNNFFRQIETELGVEKQKGEGRANYIVHSPEFAATVNDTESDLEDDQE